MTSIKFLFWTFCLFLYVGVAAQSDSLKTRRFALTLSPLTLLNPSYPALQLGASYRFSPQSLAEIEYGQAIWRYAYPLGGKPAKTYAIPYFRASADFKHLFPSRKRSRLYVGAGLLCIGENRYKANGYYLDKDERVMGYEKGKIVTTHWIPNFKAGFLIPIPSQFYLDLYASVGPRFIVERVRGAENTWTTYYINPIYVRSDNSSRTTLYGTLNFKLGWLVF